MKAESKANREFVVGGCFMAGKGAVVYSKSDGSRFVIAETIAGRKISRPMAYPDEGFPGNEAGQAANALAYLGIAGFASIARVCEAYLRADLAREAQGS